MIRNLARSIQPVLVVGGVLLAVGLGFPVVSAASNGFESDLKPIEEVLEVVFVATWEVVDDEGRPIEGAYGGRAQIRYQNRVALDDEVPGRRFIRLGDELRAPYNAAPYFGKVVGFKSDGVRIQWGDDVKVVGVPDMLDALRSGGPSIGTSVGPELRESYRVGELSWFVGTDEVDRIITNHEEMIGAIQVERATSIGEGALPAGLSLTKVPDKSFAYQRGFREGDVLRTLNGKTIESTAWAIRYFKENTRTRSFTFEVDRAGELVWITFSAAR